MPKHSSDISFKKKLVILTFLCTFEQNLCAKLTQIYTNKCKLVNPIVV